MEETHIPMETTPISLALLVLLVEEQRNSMDYQKVLREEEENRRINSCILWLHAGDRNTKLFHYQSIARIWKNQMYETRAEDGSPILVHTQVKEARKPPQQYSLDH
jgi:hypothetical protein